MRAHHHERETRAILFRDQRTVRSVGAREVYTVRRELVFADAEVALDRDLELIVLVIMRLAVETARVMPVQVRMGHVGLILEIEIPELIVTPQGALLRFVISSYQRHGILLYDLMDPFRL